MHRDLAARNILVNREQDGRMTAKVADFGLTRSVCTVIIRCDINYSASCTTYMF